MAGTDDSVGTITILSGGTTSAVLDIASIAGRSPVALFIASPGTLTGTVTLQAATLSGNTFVPLQSAGANITLAVSVGTQITDLSAGAIRLVSGSSEGADRVFQYRLCVRPSGAR
jgi:hypothetical protein